MVYFAKVVPAENSARTHSWRSDAAPLPPVIAQVQLALLASWQWLGRTRIPQGEIWTCLSAIFACYSWYMSYLCEFEEVMYGD